MEMVKLFQLQLEHYEKVEGIALSLEGKANQLSMMVRGNLPAAMQGLVVVPIFAGYDERRADGRLFSLRRHRRPLRGARLRRHRLGQPARRHRHQARATGAELRRDDAVDLVCRALWEAADADSATGGPDPLRGIYPVVATITADGFVRADDDELATRYRAIADTVRDRTAVQPSGGCRPMSMPFYVAPEQVMKDRADYARKGIARGRPPRRRRGYADGIAIVAENPSTTLRKISEIYDRIAFAGVGRYNEFDQLRVAGVRAADLKGYQYSRDDVDARSLANQYAQILGQVFTHEMKPMEVEILVAEVGVTLRRRPAVPHPLRRHRGRRARLQRARRRRRHDHTRLAEAAGSTPPDALDLGAVVRAAVSALAGPDRTVPAADLEVAVLVRGPRGAASGGSTDDEVAALLPAADTHRRQHRRHLSPAVAIDLNSDVGEVYGVWQVGDDEALIPLISSANVACGFHGGDPIDAARHVRARRRPTGWRSAPRSSYPDLVGFGRRYLDMSEASCATPCSTSSERSTRSPRWPGPRSPTSSRTARCTTPRSTTRPKRGRSWAPPPSTTRRSPCSASPARRCSPPPNATSSRRCRRRSSTGPTSPTAGSCRARSTAR